MKKHNNGYFFLLDGKNGATYIFNIKNSDAVTHSLKFYKARSLKQKVMKITLKVYLNSLGLFSNLFALSVLKNKHEIESYLGQLNKQAIDIDFNTDENSSILISPMRDKVIVHHHNNYFHKFAFGNSYAKVQNEAKIYKLLSKPLQNFTVSKLYDYINTNNEFCSFKLSSKKKSMKKDINLTAALIEMFNISRQDNYLFSVYLEDLTSRYVASEVESNAIVKVLNKLKVTYHANSFISLGLVHRDFKHWNTNTESGLLIYDFEEAVTNGLPLEDLLNYQIDPIINYLSPVEVTKKIFETKNVKIYEDYLTELEIKIDFQVLLYCYLIERAIFWMNAAKKETSVKYSNLLEYIITVQEEPS